MFIHRTYLPPLLILSIPLYHLPIGNPLIIFHVGKIIVHEGLEKNHFAEAWPFFIHFTRLLLALLFMCVDLFTLVHYLQPISICTVEVL